MKKKLIIPISLISLIALIAVLYVSYGFVSARITNNELSKKQTFMNQKLEIEYSDGTETLTSNNTSFIPGSTITKTFTIKNNGNVKLNFKIMLENVSNTFTRKEDIVYELYLNDQIMLSNIYPSFDTGIAYNQTLNVNETKNYTLKIIYNNSEENQIIDQGKIIQGKLSFKEQPAVNNIKILGNSIQNGIPTLDNPIEIESVGEKSPNLFEYKAPEIGQGIIVEKLENGAIVKGNSNLIENIEDYRWDYGWYRPGNTTAGANGIKLYTGDKITVSADMTLLEIGLKENNPSIKIYLYSRESNTGYTDSTSHSLELNKRKKISQTFTITETLSGETFYPIFCINSHKIKIENIQIEKGDVATEYVPYNKYKLPITVDSKNIADPRQVESFVKGISSVLNGKYTKITKDESGNRILELYCASGYSDYTGPVENYSNLQKIFKEIFKEKTQYTISFDYYKRINKQGMNLAIKYTDGTIVDNNALNNNNANEIANEKYSFTFTTAANKTVESIDLNYNNGTTYIYLDTLQIEEGTEKTDYVPYVEPISHTIYLDEPLRGINDNKDELNLKTGNITRNIEEITLDGSRNWNVGTPELTNTYILGYYALNPLSKDLTYPDTSKSINYSLSNKLITRNIGVSSNDDEFIQVYGRHLFIRVNKNNFGDTLTTNNTDEDKQKIKNWLVNNPIIVNYSREESYSLESDKNLLNDKFNFYTICPTCNIKVNSNIKADIVKE